MLTDPIPLVAFFVAFLAAIAAGRPVIQRLHILKFGQNINTDVKGHAHKQGTPTMGGVLFVIGVTAGLAVACLVGRGFLWHIAPVIAVYLVFLAHAGIGFLDDYLSIKRGKSLGLKARQKLLLQIIVAGLFLAWLARTGGPLVTTVHAVVTINMGPFYYVFALLLLVGLSNATNLTDGVDGLAGGLAVPVSLGLAWTTTIAITGYPILNWFAYALAGSCLAFLWFNAHPAKVFMGDTGSLALGASFAAMAIVDKQELLVLVMALMYLVEMASVMIQVTYFKATKGKRVFKMSPIHHHFELSGWPETRVVARFLIVGVLALGAAFLLKPVL